MYKKIIRKGYTSELDHFLKKFDETHPLSDTQIKEIEKHKRIAAKRDGIVEEQESFIWKEF